MAQRIIIRTTKLIKHVILAMHLVIVIICYNIYLISCQAVVLTNSSDLNKYCLNNQTCGVLTVRYPFRINDSAYSACPVYDPDHFDLNCKSSGELYLPQGIYGQDTTVPSPTQNGFRVVNILNDSLIVDVSNMTASLSGTIHNTSSTLSVKCTSLSMYHYILFNPYPSPYIISDDNAVVTFGCYLLTLSIAGDLNPMSQTPLALSPAPAPSLTSSPAPSPAPSTSVSSADSSSTSSNLSATTLAGCVVSCPFNKNNSACGGHTCCVSPLVQNTPNRFVQYAVEALNTTSPDVCYRDHFGSVLHPNFSDFPSGRYYLKVDWALQSNITSDIDALIRAPNYACSARSTPVIVEGVPGYRCACDSGFLGDGYSKGTGCQDINECENHTQTQCIIGKTKCINTYGSYICKCRAPFHVGDGRKDGSGCKLSTIFLGIVIASCVLFFLVVLGGTLYFFWVTWKKQLRKKYFILNGGLKLKEYISKAGGREEMIFFTLQELSDATKNYADDMKMGSGGFGTVFRGRLNDGKLVAIKRANQVGGVDDQFINEMVILTQINHRNIVKLLGCCLEAPRPLLVYELVSNGNVAENLKSPRTMNWEQRMKVATQTAEALAYLHNAACPPILHRDVKPANVLLDENLDAKVADFGMSRLVPEGVDHVSTAVKGTIGYLDPEYFQTLQLTDKSDVYSFGVMLVELITGMKLVDNEDREPRFVNLAILFITRMEQTQDISILDDLIDPRLKPTHQCDKLLLDSFYSSTLAVAKVAFHCLALQGVNRPSMSKVVHDLHSIHNGYMAHSIDKIIVAESSPSLPKIDVTIEDNRF